MKPITLLVLSKPTARHLALLDKLPHSTRIVVGDNAEMFAEAAPEAQVLMNGMMPKTLFHDVFVQCKNLQWVHSLSAGLENSLFPELVASPLPMTNSRGVFARSLAEWVITGCLYFDKFLARLAAQKAAHEFKAFDVEELHGKTMGIVGYGRIGQTTALLAEAFGMKVITSPSSSGKRHEPNVAVVDLDYLFSESDVVSLHCPLTPETKHLVNAQRLARMKPTAFLLNTSRGPLIDEAALAEALNSGRIAAAALDVLSTEPPSSDNPLLAAKNCLITPHNAWAMRAARARLMKTSVDNVRAFLAGRPRNVVSR